MKTQYCTYTGTYYKYFTVQYDNHPAQWPDWCLHAVLEPLKNHNNKYFFKETGMFEENVIVLKQGNIIIIDIETNYLGVWDEFGVANIILEKDLPNSIKEKLGIEVEQEILPCRFCNEIPTFRTDDAIKPSFMFVCMNSDCEINVSGQWEDTKEETIRVWNKHMEIKQ